MFKPELGGAFAQDGRARRRERVGTMLPSAPYGCAVASQNQARPVPMGRLDGGRAKTLLQGNADRWMRSHTLNSTPSFVSMQ
jgi:hypothetical protein